MNAEIEKDQFSLQHLSNNRKFSTFITCTADSNRKLLLERLEGSMKTDFKIVLKISLEYWCIFGKKIILLKE